jgi:transcriptional regulator with XRE-family HTH domain
LKFSVILALMLEKYDMSKDELAKCVGVTNTLVAYWLQGAKIPSVAVLIAVANVFNCSLDELVGRNIRKDTL